MIQVPIPSLRRGERDSIFLSRSRENVRGQFFVPVSSQVPLVATARSGLANSTQSFTISAPSDAYCELFSLSRDVGGVANDIVQRTYIMLSEYANGYQRQLMPRPCTAEHVFGTGQNPFFITDPYSEPIMLRPEGQLSGQIYNTSTSGSTSYTPSAEGRRIGLTALREDRELDDGLKATLLLRKKVYPYWIPLNLDVGAAGSLLGLPGITVPVAGQATAQFMVFNNKPGKVLITRIMGSALTAGVAGDTPNLFSMDLYDPQNRKLNYQPIIFPAGAGPATFPYVLPTPIVIRSNQVMWARLYNLVTDATTDVFLTLQGLAVDDFD